MNLPLIEKLIRTAQLNISTSQGIELYEYTLGDGFSGLRTMEEQFLIGINLMLQNQTTQLQKIKSSEKLVLAFTSKDKVFNIIGAILPSSLSKPNQVHVELTWDKAYDFYLDTNIWEICCMDKGFHPSRLPSLTI
jgi:hypothetical protein